jgi:hypothetical protein
VKTARQRKNQYRTWEDMPYAAMNKIEADERAARIAATKKLSENLPPNAFADNVVESDFGTYYPKGTYISPGGHTIFDDGEDIA